jgi:hypothetical protein
VTKKKRFGGIVSACPTEIPEVEVGRPYLSSGRAVMERARLNKSVMLELLNKILSKPVMRAKTRNFTADDLRVAENVVRSLAPDLLPEIKFAIQMYDDNRKRARKGRGRPSELRYALALGFLKHCGEKSAAETVASAIWKQQGIVIEADSIERSYRRHKRTKALFEYALLHRLHELAHL